MPPKTRAASHHPGPRLARLPLIWFGQHLRGALASLGHLSRAPLPTFMTVAVIGIALALPGALYVFTHNLERLGGRWEQTATLSLFLRPEVSLRQAEALAARLTQEAGIAAVSLVPREQALEELRAETGFAEAVAQLEENPLPVVLILRPANSGDDLAALEALGDRLGALPESDFVRLDSQWVRRFQGLVQLIERGVLVLALALASGVLLIIGNTIRLEIENRREEIEIMELVGATPGFIRRPFLYTGAWYGLLGGATAWLLIAFALVLLQKPVSQLAALYQTEFALSGLDPGALGLLLTGSALLGLVGSGISVSRHLRAMELG